MKSKLIVFSFFSLAINLVFSQNKKEQIEALNFRIDSLIMINHDERILSIEKIKEVENLNKKIVNLNTTDSTYKKEITKLNSDIEFLYKKESSNQQIIIELRNQIDLFNKKYKLKNCIVINSDRKIKDFDVQIIFYPKEKTINPFDDDSHFNGYCVFNFFKDGYISPILLEDFPLSYFTAKGIVFTKDGAEILNCPLQELTIDLTKLPISFRDINFDGEDELIIEYKGLGVQFSSHYEVFTVSNERIYPDNYWFPEVETLDDNTRFDPIKKQISFYHSNGVDPSFITVYQAIFINNNFESFKFLRKNFD